jgi:hypothetical protein
MQISFASYHENIAQEHQSDQNNRTGRDKYSGRNSLKGKLLQNTECNTYFISETILVFQALLVSAAPYIWTWKTLLSDDDKVAAIGCYFRDVTLFSIDKINNNKWTG